MIHRGDLDHVAVAVEQWADAWPHFAVDLGGEWVSGGAGPGFSPMQLRYANEMKVEVISPHRVDVNDFLRRFLDRRGPGPHHLTFKVPDIRDALGRCEAAGISPVNVAACVLISTVEAMYFCSLSTDNLAAAPGFSLTHLAPLRSARVTLAAAAGFSRASLPLTTAAQQYSSL